MAIAAAVVLPDAITCAMAWAVAKAPPPLLPSKPPGDGAWLRRRDKPPLMLPPAPRGMKQPNGSTNTVEKGLGSRVDCLRLSDEGFVDE